MKRMVLFLLVLAVTACNQRITVEETLSEEENVAESFDGNYEFELFLDRQYYGDETNQGLSGETTEEFYFDPDEFTLEYYNEVKEGYENILSELESFDVDTLNYYQYYDYFTYKDYLEKEIHKYSYPMYDSLFASTDGVVDYIILDFTEFDFSTGNASVNYIKNLKEVSPYLKSALNFTVMQAENGYFLTDNEADIAIEEINNFIAKEEDNELINVFVNNISSSVSDTRREKLIEEVNAIVKDDIIPTLKEVVETLETLKGHRASNGGLAGFIDGKEYYEVILQENSGLNSSMDEIYAIINEEVDKLIDEFDIFYSKYPYFESKGYQGTLREPKEIIEFFKNASVNDYPDRPEIKYVVDYLDESIADSSTAAFYLTPEYETYTETNVIRVNPASSEDLLGLIATLAHEGYPGHMNQFTYFYSLNPHPLRTYFNYDAYLEGWAMYSEYSSLDYLDDLDEKEKEYYILVNKLDQYLSAFSEVAVNGYNWTLDDLYNKFNYYFSGDTLSYYFKTACDAPTFMTPYAFGTIMMEKLLNKAKEQLQDKFNILELNKVILDNGPREFHLIEKDLDEYIEYKLNEDSLFSEDKYYDFNLSAEISEELTLEIGSDNYGYINIPDSYTLYEEGSADFINYRNIDDNTYVAITLLEDETSAKQAALNLYQYYSIKKPYDYFSADTAYTKINGNDVYQIWISFEDGVKLYINVFEVDGSIYYVDMEGEEAVLDTYNNNIVSTFKR